MKKALLIVAMLLSAVPVMAATTITAVNEGVVQTPDGNYMATVRIEYSSSIDVRAFALDINIESGPAFQRIRDFKVGESNGAAVPPGTSGYGIFPSRFRDFIVVTGPNWVDVNYNPTTAYNEPETTDHNSGMGWPKMIVEMGTLYAGDANKPALSGTLFRFDVNGYGSSGTFHVKVAANALRGGVVDGDGNSIIPANLTLVGCDIVFPAAPCILPNVVSQTEAAGTLAITNAGFALGVRTTSCSDVAGIVAGDIISTNPAAGSYTCGISVDYVVSTGGCCVIVPQLVGTLCANAAATITGAGLTVGTVGTAYSNTVPAGTIISQNPTNPNCVPLGSAVNYVCSLGPCVVPNVVNLFEAPIMTAGPNAVGMLTAAGFTTARSTSTSTTVAAGKVISTAPASGATPGCGTVVTMTVSTGRGTCATCKGDMVPDSVKQASDMTSLKANLVTAFTRTGLYKADRGSAVTGDKWNICGDLIPDNALQASDMSNLKAQLVAGFNAGGLYKAPFVPINVPAKTQAQMQTAITAANLVVGTVSTANSPTVPVGYVISTTPAYPTYRNCNTTVNILVSLGP